MMDRDLFKELINKPEGRFIDFKASIYDFSVNSSKKGADFIKDILSFANTVRDSSAYIIFGIKEDDNKCVNLIGLDSFPDDSILQQKSNSKIYPVPYFLSYSFKYDEKLFGIIEFPVHHYDRPLIAIEKGLKGLDVDKIYVRNGSSNAEASFTQIQELTNWLNSLKSKRYLNSRESEIDSLIADFANTVNKLSELFSRCYRLRHLIKDDSFNSFIESELFGLKSGVLEESDFYNYRLIRTPVTPYEITIQQFGRRNADQMIDYLFDHDKFREVDVLFSKSISEIESIIEDLKLQPKLLVLSEPYKNVFPEITSNIENASMYYGPQMMNNLYLIIRRVALKLLKAVNN